MDTTIIYGIIGLIHVIGFIVLLAVINNETESINTPTKNSMI
jgi:uncharacterized membrane protein YuzA (DUF378 family)